MASELSSRNAGIVVGVDGSAASASALSWAVRAALRRGERVVAVTAWSRPSVPVGVSGMVVMESAEPYHEMAERMLDDAVRGVDEELSADEQVDIERRTIEGSAGRVLTDLAETATMLVVGGHGAGRRFPLLGSTAGYCLRHAVAPVVVVREKSSPDAMRMVVGVDGSDSSLNALRWAAAEAELRGLPLTVLRAWTMTTAPSPEGDRLGYVAPFEEWGRAAADETRAWVDATLGEDATLVHEVETAHGGAARSLLEFVREDDLLVLGSRGRGGFRGLLLGSVSQQVAEHAACPVIVVRHPH
jgi:nucleotide-binding universal stress UspA family protein